VRLTVFAGRDITGPTTLLPLLPGVRTQPFVTPKRLAISGGMGRAAQMTCGLAGFTRVRGFRLGTGWWFSGDPLHGRNQVKP
jgi:hypothetical protein